MRPLLGLVLVMVAFISRATAADEPKSRLVVLTDIRSLTPGVAEPDDGQSLLRLILYADEFEIEGLIATSNMGRGRR